MLLIENPIWTGGRDSKNAMMSFVINISDTGNSKTQVDVLTGSAKALSHNTVAVALLS